MKTRPPIANSFVRHAADGQASADDPRVIEAIPKHLAELKRGQRPDRTEILAAHVGIESVLANCIDRLDFVHDVAPRFF